MPDIVVSFTTSPIRIHKCLPMVRSICEQTVKPVLIILNIPHVFARTSETYNIPDDIANLVTINRCDYDYGPGTKLIPTIDYLRKNNYPEDTRILYCDDDIFYQSTMLETLSKLSPMEVWTGSGFNFINLAIIGERQHNNICTIAEGYMGVFVSLNMFKEDFMNYIQSCSQYPDITLSDDIMLSNYYAKHNITIRVCAIPKKYSFIDFWQEKRILNYGNLDDALHNGASGTSSTNQKRYLSAIQILNKMTPSQRFIRLLFVNKGMPLRFV